MCIFYYQVLTPPVVNHNSLQTEDNFLFSIGKICRQQSSSVAFYIHVGAVTIRIIYLACRRSRHMRRKLLSAHTPRRRKNDETCKRQKHEWDTISVSSWLFSPCLRVLRLCVRIMYKVLPCRMPHVPHHVRALLYLRSSSQIDHVKFQTNFCLTHFQTFKHVQVGSSVSGVQSRKAFEFLLALCPFFQRKDVQINILNYLNISRGVKLYLSSLTPKRRPGSVFLCRQIRDRGISESLSDGEDILEMEVLHQLGGIRKQGCVMLQRIRLEYFRNPVKSRWSQDTTKQATAVTDTQITLGIDDREETAAAVFGKTSGMFDMNQESVTSINGDSKVGDVRRKTNRASAKGHEGRLARTGLPAVLVRLSRIGQGGFLLRSQICGKPLLI